MNFISLSFLIFLPIVTVVHFLLPQRWRWLWLLLASGCFYAAFIPRYLLVLLFIIGIDYCAAILMEKSSTRMGKKLALAGGLSTNLLVLFVFKYFSFFNDEVHRLASLLNWNYPGYTLHLILPLGLSFHTFQAMSYTIEVYRGKQPAERHLGIYALYVLFFPQLVAGPIERPQNLLPQFHAPPHFQSVAAVEGLRLILWGIFKKVVLADRLALMVDSTYASWHLTPGVRFWIANFCFAFQIYYDFSGYSDIARGSAKILGVELMKNFNYPYFATSIADFWRRWHISLSTWFRDYVYFPLGGNRGSRARTLLNLFVVFTLSGLWHGANRTFLVWGWLHFCYFAVVVIFGMGAVFFPPRESALGGTVRALFTFIFVMVAWIFFRAPNLEIGLQVLMESFILRFDEFLAFRDHEVQFNLGLIFVVTAGEWLWVYRRGPQRLTAAPTALRWAGYYALLAVIMTLGVFNNNQFIYFQF